MVPKEGSNNKQYVMVDNKHFLQFMNRLGITTMQIATALDIKYNTARLRVETLKFTPEEICQLSEWTTIPIIDLINIITGRASIKEISIPYATTKEMALEKLRQDDDFIRMIIECSFVGAGQKRRVVTQSEISVLKMYLKNYPKI